MSLQDAQCLSESLDADDVSSAWLVWSRAAEAALADSCRFSGGLIPNRSLVLRRGCASFRVVRLGGHKVRKVRDSASDVGDGVLAVGPCYPVTAGDLAVLVDLGVGEFHHVVVGLHRRLCDFIHSVAVHRRDDAIRGWRNLGSGGSFNSSL